jgi:transposase
MNFGYSKIFGIKGLQWLRDLRVIGNDQILLQEYISQIDFLTKEIKNIESKIRIEASKNESVKILMSMTGIDYFSAMMISSEIGDIDRFSSPQKLVSWAGLCPTAARKDYRLRKFYLRIAKRHGYHIAITHVVNKMCTILDNINSLTIFPIMQIQILNLGHIKQDRRLIDNITSLLTQVN